MNWLTAALAFAITMLLFTSMVSAIVESVQRLFSLRRRGLQWMLHAMYEEVSTVRPDLIAQVGRAQQVLNTPVQNVGGVRKVWAWLRAQFGSATVGDSASRFLDTMTANRQAKEFVGWLPHLLRPQHVQSLTPVEFAQRLARTDIGAALKQKADDEWQHLLNGVLERFDFYGQAAGETFRQRAKAISIIISFIFALGLNINALALFYAFATRPQLAEAMVAQQQEIQRRYEEAQKRAAIPPAGDTITDEEAKRIQSDIQDRLKELQAQFGDLIKLGLPIGWSKSRCRRSSLEEGSAEQSKQADKEDEDAFCRALSAGELPVWKCEGDCGWQPYCVASLIYAGAWISFPFSHPRWLFSTLLAGLLIGLGGPFWYNVCTSLSRAAQLARAAGDGLKGAPPKDGSKEGDEAAPASEAPLLSTPARAFAAAIILDKEVPSLGRILLNSRGEPEDR